MSIDTNCHHGRRHRLSAIAVVCAMALPIGVTAAATVLPAIPAAAAPTPPTPDGIAQAQAIASGTAVTVVADTTATSQIVANPDGSFTQTSWAQPRFVQQGGRWVSTSATLRANTDGTYSPIAAQSGLVLSGGGSGPLATFTDDAGHSMSVSMPMALPVPTVNGDTALYPSALPGVDLSVTAGVDGGIDEVLVVHSAAAAANPALTSLRLAISTKHLRVTIGRDGSINATDPSSGTIIYTAPPPVMWDSPTPPAATAPPQRTDTGQSATAATPGDRSGDPTNSSVTGPGRNAAVTAIGVTAATGAIVLTPPTAALRGDKIRYPAYLDPGISGTLSAKAYTQSYHPTAVAYNPTDNLRVGFDDWTTGCGSPCYQNGITRTFLKFTGFTALDTTTLVTAGALTLNQTGASCSSTEQIDAALTANHTSFDSSIDWANQPVAGSVEDSLNMSGSNGDKTFSVADMGTYLANNSYSIAYVVVYGNTQSDDCTYRHFGLNPTLSFTYWGKPNAPTSLHEMNGNATYSCNTASPGTWVPKADTNQISLNDNASTPDPDSEAMTEDMFLSTNGGAYSDKPVSVTETSPNAAIPVTKTISVADGSTYKWYATTSNAHQTSNAAPSGAPGSAACYFRYDATSPATPTFSSAAYPANGPTTVAKGASGTITVTSNDAGTNPSGVGTIKYDIDGTTISSGGITGSATATGGAATITIPLADLHWGTNTLWAQAIDKAGNNSAAVPYNFFVQQAAFCPCTAGAAGDITGDAMPDLVTVDAAGDLQLYANPSPTNPVNPTGDLTADPHQYGGQILIPANEMSRWAPPDSASASGAIIAHAGSFSAGNTDDIIMVQNGFLAVATNPDALGSQWTFADDDVAKPACASCTNYNATDWSSVTQMIAIPSATAGARPSLLTVENFNNTIGVWLYKPLATSFNFNSPVLVSIDYSDWHWESTQLLAAGPVPGTTGDTLLVRYLTTDHIDSVPNITGDAGVDPAAPVDSVLASGFDPDSVPLVSAAAQADSNGNWSLWGTDPTGVLNLYPIATSGGVLSMGSAVPVSASGWANQELTLGSTYRPYDNTGTNSDGRVTTNAFDTATANQFSYSATALRDATADNGAIFACPSTWTSSGCPSPSGITPGDTIIASDPTNNFDIFALPTPNDVSAPNNYIANGQVLPVPVPNTSGPAHTVSFLGTAVTGSGPQTVTATVTYTNGDTQTLNVTFGDWTISPAASNNTPVLTSPYRINDTTGAMNTTPTYLFASSDQALLDKGAPLGTNVQIASIRLGVKTSVHIFSIAVT